MSDLFNELSDRTLYYKVDSVPVSPNKPEKLLTLKLNLPNVEDFKRFVGPNWAQYEPDWAGQQVIYYDKNIGGFKVTSVSYKDSLFDDKPVVVVLIKYEVDDGRES